MREATWFAKKFAIDHGPIVMNVHTYRYAGHSMSDPGTTYRVPDFDSHWWKNMDPLKIARQWLYENLQMSEVEVKKIDKAISSEIDEDIEKAMACPETSIDQLFLDVYDPSEKIFIRAPNYENSIFVKEHLIN